MKREHVVTSARWFGVLLLLACPINANAQKPFVGAGAGVSSIPRSRAPLCGSARRLTGPALSAVAGIHTGRMRIAAVVDVTQTLVHDAADCVPSSGITLDTVFAEASTAAWTAAADVSFQIANPMSVSVGAGLVPNHDSWFVSGGVAAQYRKLRADVVGRWHRTSFEEITRDFTGQGVHEISRTNGAENSWGGLVRLVIVTR